MASAIMEVDIKIKSIMIEEEIKCKSLVGGIKSIHLLINGEWFEIPKGYTKKEWSLFQLILKEYFNG